MHNSDVVCVKFGDDVWETPNAGFGNEVGEEVTKVWYFRADCGFQCLCYFH